MKGVSLFFFFCLIWSVGSIASPKKVVIIRHGEKPTDGAELSSVGCERAYQLPQFFGQWNDIAAIYAQQPTGIGSSVRPIQTVTPTAQSENLKINNSFHRDDYSNLVADILNNRSLNGKTVIISWEHAVIPKIAEGFGIQLTSVECGEIFVV